MGCVASKDADSETKYKFRSAQSGKQSGMFMPVQAQDSGDNGYHMVSLTSSTYGILKADDSTNNGTIGVNSGSLSNSSHDAFYEKLKHFDVPDEMVTKSWSEVSRSLPKMPPASKSTDGLRRIDSPRLQSRSGMDSPRLQSRGLDSPRLQSRSGIDRGMDSPRLRSRSGMDSPRLQSRGLDSPRLQSRGIDSPRLQSRSGIDSPRQRASARRTDSPRRLPSQATKSGHETINTWELMDGLDEDGNILVKQRPKPVERIPGSPGIKSFERSATFSTIHTLSELDSGDPSMAIVPGPAGNFLISSNSAVEMESTKPVKVMSRSVSTPVAPKRDEITVRLTPSSPLPSVVARAATPSSDVRRPRPPPVAPMTLTPEANAVIQEISNAVSKSLLPQPSPTLRSVGVKKGGDSSRPRQPILAPLMVAPGGDNILLEEEEIDAMSKSHRPPPSPLLRSAGSSKQSHHDSPSPRQPARAPMAVPAPEVNDTREGGSNAGSGKFHLPPPSPLLRSAGTRQSSDSSRPRQPVTPPTVTMALEASDLLQEGSANRSHLPIASPSLRTDHGSKNATGTMGSVRNRSQHSKSPMVKAIVSPMSLNTKLEAEIERAISDERSDSGPRHSFSKQPAAKATSSSPLESGDASHRVRAAADSKLRQEAGAFNARPQRVIRELDDSTPNQPNREVPRFASPIHVLSLAASFDLENRKNSMSPLDPKAPLDQSGRRSFSKQQSMPSSSLRASIPFSGQGVGNLQSHASAPSHGRRGRVGSQKDTSLLVDSDLLAFEEALEMLSTDHERQNVRDRKSEAMSSLSGVTGRNARNMITNGMSFDGPGGRQGNGNKGANSHLAAQREAISSKSPAARRIVKPDPWARFEVKCPPAGEGRVVLYTTSLRGIRKTFEACNNARFIFESFSIDIDERDISIHAEFRQELKDLAGKPVPVPQAFIKGRYIGGMDIITQLHEDGTLATLVDGLPPQLSRGECDGCGGVRFVPCSDCSGSTKVVNEAKEVVRCGECNENGLMRCPICY